MGRKPQITKEIILETAFRMLIRDGHTAINVKTLSAEIGCSTQPIVWHFENMNGFWQAFSEYCIAYAKSQFTVWNDNVDDLLTETARKYIAIACNTPNLFWFVFADSNVDRKNSKVVHAMQLESTGRIIELLCQEKGLTERQAASFLMNYEFYIHGVASFTASGFCCYPEEEIVAMANQAKDAFLAYEMKHL